ncbi:DUF294 nucleotidyltransferase-like domain-containing protein [Cyclobacterium sp.]|uniref:DUF294 nucleotidyltransferase-like domain-containing protein n=1 Tax=Cyclobacterium sp. TaxID=1966343 RepID=UPI001994B5C2|nr:DUF294 nucleotidyltransferase-like domain-containing protein [Cyclobacterium sp.]MBD3631260.1 CBS domain-containing protein [Cyclobacterium sp.]
MPSEPLTVLDDFYVRTIGEIPLKEILYCVPETSIAIAAQIMRKEMSSCLFVGRDKTHIHGVITDITLRDNVLAQGVSPERPIAEIMDKTLVSIPKDAFVYEALLLMFRTKTRYLLVSEAGKYIGVTSRNKILTIQSQSPFVFIQSVKLALDKDELKVKWKQVPGIVDQLIQRGVRAEIINQIISTIADTIALRVIEQVVKERGKPPANFVFFVLGSEGRKEQTLKTDQDNAIIYEDKANEQRALVRDYFLGFAKEVSDRLHDIGFNYCKGGYMASNPKWTHSLSHWKRNYAAWFQESSTETVMSYGTFFDCRPIYGDFSLLNDLKTFMDGQLQYPLERFYYNMAQNALQYDTQLTWLRNIRTFKVDKEQVFDIKKAMTPMVDAIRLYALANRIFETNTGKRLKILTERGIFTTIASDELYQAYYYLMGLRLEKQAATVIKENKKPVNYIKINTLTKVQVVTIREIFKVIRDLQLKVKIQFTKTF